MKYCITVLLKHPDILVWRFILTFAFTNKCEWIIWPAVWLWFPLALLEYLFLRVAMSPNSWKCKYYPDVIFLRVYCEPVDKNVCSINNTWQ